MPAATAPAEPAAPLSRGFYSRGVVQVAADLIGCVLVHGPCSGVIVETEAYHQSEPASHAYLGPTPRTRTLFGPPGDAYVYLSYGVHELLNAVCEPDGIGAAVLIRALEPLTGIELMASRRGPAGASVRGLCSGPGKLTQALGVSLSDNGRDLSSGAVTIRERSGEWLSPQVSASRRIGITKATELPWRFCAAGSRFLSRPG